MDSFETASNISDHSECLSSNLSSLSGLTGYEEELYDLKHLINPSRSPYLHNKPNNNDHHQFDVFEERIKKLNVELQNALKLNEKYKNDLYNLERKTELAFHEKFEKLMRYNAQLEAQLSVANGHVRKFSGRSNDESSKPNLELSKKTSQLEKECFELNSKINLLQSEVEHWKKETEASEVRNSGLKLELEETSIAFSSKSSSVVALKSKIVDLHVEMQSLSQENIKLKNSLGITANELESFKKSERWYKEQLHERRAQKLEASEEISKLQSLLVTKDHDLEVANSNLLRLKNKYEELRLVSQQEKENFSKMIEKLKKTHLNEASSPTIIEVRDPTEILDYESTIASLTKELMTIKEAVNEQQGSFEGTRKQNSELIARLQEIVNKKEISIVNLECDKKDLKVRLDILAEQCRENERLILKVVNEKSEVEVALDGAKREKREIETAVSEIRENFSKFIGSYNKIKEELYEKSKEMLELQQTNKKLRELEEDNAKLQIKSRSNWEANQQTKEKLESEIAAYQKSTNNLKEELQMFKETLATTTNDLQLKDKLKNDLSKEVSNLMSNITLYQQENWNLKEKLGVTEQILDESKNKLHIVSEANKLLQIENSELKEKLTKFVMNNFNGFNKATKVDELNKTKTDERNELEQWFLNVLEWILGNLLEIHACSSSKREVKEFVPKFPLQKPNEKVKALLEKVNQFLVCLTSTRFAEFDDFQQMSTTNKDLKLKLSKVKNKMLERIRGLEEKCNLLRQLQEKDIQVLQSIRVVENKCSCKQSLVEENGAVLKEAKLLEEIKQLKILCKAKELENKEKQKRYEVNNRTLLKKVKEHMRGRNSAEKRCSYLQELYNNVFDDLNLYKLQENSRNSELQNLQSVCENYKNIIVKMKQEMLRLEKELGILEATKALACVKCVEYESLKENVANLGMKLRICEESLKEKEVFINNLQLEVQQITLTNTTLQKENKSFKEKVTKLTGELSERTEDLTKLELALEKDRKTLEELNEKLLAEQKQHSACIMQLESAQQLSQLNHEKNLLFSEEIESLNSKLNHNNQDLSSLKSQKSLLENDLCQKETVINNFQTELQTLQSTVTALTSDKYFLQRLCNDLKLALHTCLNQSKVLKKHIQTLSSESRECNSLPDAIVNLPSPSKYDDGYINQLLKQSSAPPIQKPLGDLQNCLNSLKKEMVCLRKQVTERTGYT